MKSISFIYEYLKNNIEMNTLMFPGHSHKYDFTMDDGVEYQEVFDTSDFTVKKYRHTATGICMAVKFIPLILSSNKSTNMKLLNNLIKEIHNIQKLHRSEYIVDFYGCCIFEGDFLIFMEAMDYSLKEVYTQYYQKFPIFPENLLGCIATIILDALIMLKEENIMHRDIKPENILINNIGSIKLCDFGTSRILELGTTAGTYSYMPPERLTSMDNNFGHKSTDKLGPCEYDDRYDIWSLGITLCELICNKYPLLDSSYCETLYYDYFDQSKQKCIDTFNEKLLAIIKKSFPSEHYSNELRIFIKKCFEEKDDYNQLIDTVFYKQYKENDYGDVIVQFIQTTFNKEPTKDEANVNQTDTKNYQQNCQTSVVNVRKVQYKSAPKKLKKFAYIYSTLEQEIQQLTQQNETMREKVFRAIAMLLIIAAVTLLFTIILRS